MPYVLKPNKIFAKAPDKSGFLPQNVVTDRTTNDMTAEIESAGAEQIAAIQSKGIATRATIPDDYTALADGFSNWDSACEELLGIKPLFWPADMSDRSGLTITVDGLSATISGTATKIAFWNIIAPPNQTNFLKAGKRYRLYFQSSGGVNIAMYYIPEGGTSYTRLFRTTSTFEFTIPEGASGFILRVDVSTGVTVDETILCPILVAEDSLLAASDQAVTNSSIISFTSGDCNNYKDVPGVYIVTSSNGQYATNFPFNNSGVLAVITSGAPNSETVVQIALSSAKDMATITEAAIRMYTGSSWGRWFTIGSKSAGLYFSYLDKMDTQSKTANGLTMDWNGQEFVINGTANNDISKINLVNAALPYNGIMAGRDYTFYVSSSVPSNQLYLEIYGRELIGRAYKGVSTHSFPDDLGANLTIRIRATKGVTFENATLRVVMTDAFGVTHRQVNQRETDCNDVLDQSVRFISSSAGVTNLTNYAYHAAGWLITDNINSNPNVGVFQLAIPHKPSDTNKIMLRTRVSGVWGDWSPVGGATTEQTTANNFIKDITQNEITNTYTITTTPTITTDAHGWLQAADTETQDETDKTDMTGAIMSMLNNTGYCHLGEGVYYVSGNIDMPEGSTLEGCGHKTVVKLLDSVENGYCVRVTRYCTVKGIRFKGRYSSGTADVASDAIGGRDGIHFVATKDGNETPAKPTVRPDMITNCWFEGFSGSALYCHNTGGGMQESLIVSDLYMEYCTVGINVDYYSEYSKFTNVIVFRCYYGCINNGGNNVFTACTFHGTIGWLADNSYGDKRNNTHGSVIGCTFNHIDNWNNSAVLGMGDAIVIKNCNNGYIFTGCQLWYGEIRIENSCGVAFSDCLIGGGTPEIEVTGSYPAFFSGCVFHAMPKITVTSGTRFDNCYLDTNGSAVTA